MFDIKDKKVRRIFICIGVAGVGKDTYINKQSNTINLSSDNIRLEMFGTLNCQSTEKNAIMFNEMRKRLFKYIKESGRDIYYNATNLNRKKRIQLYKDIKQFGLKNNINIQVTSLVFLKPLIDIIRQNNLRDEFKRVPEEKIFDMYKNLQIPRLCVDCDSMYIVNGINIHEFKHEFIGIDFNHDNPFHKETIREHIDMVTRLAEKRCDTRLIDIARFHDLGKSICRVYDEDKGYFRYNNHNNVSAMYYLASIGNNFTEMRLDILETIYQHMQKGDKLTDKLINRNKLDKGLVNLIIEFNKIDNAGRIV